MGLAAEKSRKEKRVVDIKNEMVKIGTGIFIS